MSNGLTFRQAQAAQGEAIIALLDEAAAWLLGRGIRQWSPGDFSSEIPSAIERGEVYIAASGGEMVGVFRLMPSDPSIWGSDNGDAFYLHRLTVRRAYAGRGYGKELLAEAERITASAGKRWLRLDCWEGNTVLRAFYTEAGFQHIGFSGQPQYDYRCALFERLVTEDAPSR